MSASALIAYSQDANNKLSVEQRKDIELINIWKIPLRRFELRWQWRVFLRYQINLP